MGGKTNLKENSGQPNFLDLVLTPITQDKGTGYTNAEGKRETKSSKRSGLPKDKGASVGGETVVTRRLPSLPSASDWTDH